MRGRVHLTSLSFRYTQSQSCPSCTTRIYLDLLLRFGFRAPCGQYKQACSLLCTLPKKTATNPRLRFAPIWQHNPQNRGRCARLPQNSKDTIMPKDMHQKAAEHHEQTAKAHRTAAQQHGSDDHVSARQQSAQAVEKSKAAHEHSTQANNKSQQQQSNLTAAHQVASTGSLVGRFFCSTYKHPPCFRGICDNLSAKLYLCVCRELACTENSLPQVGSST